MKASPYTSTRILLLIVAAILIVIFILAIIEQYGMRT